VYGEVQLTLERKRDRGRGERKEIFIFGRGGHEQSPFCNFLFTRGFRAICVFWAFKRIPTTCKLGPQKTPKQKTFDIFVNKLWG